MKKGAQEGRRERPGQCGPRPHPAGGAEEGSPVGLPTSGALSAAAAAGAAAGTAGWGRPSLSRAARPRGEESWARRRRFLRPPALAARPRSLRAPPARAARAARRPRSPGWRCRPAAPGRWGGRGDASETQAEAEGEAGEGGLGAERAQAAAVPVTRGKSRPGPCVRQARGGGAGGPAISRYPPPDLRPRDPARAGVAAAQRPRPARGRGRGWESHGVWGLGAGPRGGRRRTPAATADLTTPRAAGSQARRRCGVVARALDLEPGSHSLT